MANLHNLQTAMEQLEKSALRTSQGTFVKIEDLKQLMEEQDEELTEENLNRILGPRTFAQAKARIQKDPEIMGQFPNDPRVQVGDQRSIPGDL